MKIASFNVNNVNKRLDNLLAWLAEAAPDAVCLQELKAADSQSEWARTAARGVQFVALQTAHGAR